MAPLWPKVVPFVVSQLVITWGVGSSMALFFFDKHYLHFLDWISLFTWIVCFIILEVTMASNHQPAAPSLEFSNDSDSDCYIIDSGSEVEIQFGDDTESESVDLGSDDEMFEASESSTGEVTETVPDVSDDDNFGPNVPDRIVWANLFSLGGF